VIVVYLIYFTEVAFCEKFSEMNAEDLGESTIIPANRTLIRYTVDSIKEEVATIRELEADKKKILAMIDKVNRQDLIGI
jgi:DNA gyrase/topoisomerase IV subunit B